MAGGAAITLAAGSLPPWEGRSVSSCQRPYACPCLRQDDGLGQPPVAALAVCAWHPHGLCLRQAWKQSGTGATGCKMELNPLILQSAWNLAVRNTNTKWGVGVTTESSLPEWVRKKQGEKDKIKNCDPSLKEMLF